MLLQVQSFYQEYIASRSASANVDEVTEKERLNYKDFVEAFSNLIFSHPEWTKGLSSPPPVPFQWGNWLKGNPNQVYETAEGIINRPRTKPTNVALLPLNKITWVHVIPTQITPLIKNSIFAIYNTTVNLPNKPACPITFAITISIHGLGQTQACPKAAG